jgi:peroxiredoxin
MNKFLYALVVFALCAGHITAQNQPKDSAVSLTSIGARLPYLNLENMNGVKMSPYDVPANKNVVLMILNLTCGHCVEQTTAFLKNQAKFPNTFFMLVTAPIMKDYYDQFVRETGYAPQENMVVTFDMTHSTDSVFQYKGLPQIMVYGRNKKLLALYHKDTKIEKILEALNSEVIAPNDITKPAEQKVNPTKKKKKRKVF